MLQSFIQHDRLPGLAVVTGNRIAYAAGFGVRNLAGDHDPVTTRTLFHMCSITKPFVATSVMQLVELGKIDLDRPVASYLPYFNMADERFKTITVRQMVTHTSSITFSRLSG